MKRVVEFRGKKRTTLQPKNLDVLNESEKESEWICGSFSNGIDGKGAYIMPYCYTAGLIAISEDEDGEDVIEYGTDLFLGGWIQVIPESVGEFTGLYDNTKFSDLSDSEKESWLKNNAESEWKGNKIFEGDVVNFDYNYIGEKTVQWELKGKWNISDYCVTSCEVIGNVIDNPELLNK